MNPGSLDSRDSIRPEHRLAINLAGERTTREDILQFIFTESLDWNFFLSELLRNNIGPLVYDALRKNQLDAVLPPAVVQALKTSYHQTAMANLFLFQETRSIIEALNLAGIPAILFKGSALAIEIYGQAALRPCSDVDMLVAREKLPEVKKIFFDNGFSFPKDLIDERFYYRNHFHIAFNKPLKNAAVQIEVHWNLMDKYLLKGTNIDEIWKRKQPLAFEGLQTYGLAPEDEIIYLALHTLKHGYMNPYIASHPTRYRHIFNPAAENRLLWFVDLKKILMARKDTVDWNLLHERAARWGVLESVRTILILLSALFPFVEVPERILETAKPVRVSLPRRILFKTILERSESRFIRKHFLTMKGDLQFRPIRMFDILEYMFPSLESLAKIYRIQQPFVSLAIYPFHVIRTALQGGYGLSQWMIFSLWKAFRHEHEH